MNLDDETETLTLRSACSRCHGHKLRCVQVRGAQGCVRCTRAGVKCVVRPSKRARQNHAQGLEQGKKSTGLESSSSRDASRSGCRCMEQEQSVAASPSVRIAETVEMGQSRLNDLPLTPHTPANDFDVISYWETFESEDHSSSLSALEEEGNLNGLHLPREDLCFQPEIQVDVDVDVNCAALDPRSLSLLLPSPASTDSSREWNSHRQSKHSYAAHEGGSDYFSQRGTTTRTTAATTQKCEEQDRGGKTSTVSDWVARVFTLNAKLHEHQRGMRTFIETCQRGFVEFNSPAMPLGPDALNELSPTLSTGIFLETTLGLAMELLALVSEEVPSSSAEQVLQRAGTYADADQASRSTTAQSSDLLSTVGQRVVASSLEDSADFLLMLSCYTRLLGIFSSVFKCFHQIITANCASSQSNPTHALDYVLTYLPKVYIGTLSFQTNPRLALTMVVDLVQNMVAELTRSMMRIVQFVDSRNVDASTTSAGTQMPEQEGLVDCSLEQKAQVSDSIHSPSRARANLKASKGCGERLSLPDRECAAASSEGVLIDSWRTTIQTVSSTASSTIRVLKDAIV
ncbi:hypothetical protein BJX62DRAFT_192479 [Aspergillus germanicus]